MTADLERLRETHRPILSRPGYDRSRVNNPEICAACGHLWPCDAAWLLERVERLGEALRMGSACLSGHMAMLGLSREQAEAEPCMRAIMAALDADDEDEG